MKYILKIRFSIKVQEFSFVTLGRIVFEIILQGWKSDHVWCHEVCL